eukprot:Colp12_sorted_trinity150504_noHs@31753
MSVAVAKFHLGGVPEHFNAPLHIARERGIFKKHLVDVELHECLGGTGEMIPMLKEGSLDVAIALTEGLVASLAKGEDSFRIIGTYTTCPLTWAVSTGANSDIHSISDLDGKTVGISRFGSGSHIMSFVMAKDSGFKEDNKFSVLKNFKGLRDGVNDNTADCFLWETFTTKPYHDTKEVRKVGEITTPWPAFLLACRTEVLDRDAEAVYRLLAAIFEACELFVSNKEEAVERVVANYGNTPEDAAKWLSGVSYASRAEVSQQMLDKCVGVLVGAGVLPAPVPTTAMYDSRVALPTP